MTRPELHATERFSDRVDDYVRYRPGYPVEILQMLQEETGLTSDSVIADIGSGTGISAELFLRNGNPVFGVEPNGPMRQAAEELLRGFPKFRSVTGTAEQSTLDPQSIDFVIAAQAFHWFDTLAARQEFARILRPGGWVVLIWNSRRLDSTPFLWDYEALLQKFGTDYRQVRQQTVSPAKVQALFGDGGFRKLELPNAQMLDLASLLGRLRSCSYTPKPDDPNYAPMLAECEAIFRRHAESEQVCFEYDTELYFGRLG